MALLDTSSWTKEQVEARMLGRIICWHVSDRGGDPEFIGVVTRVGTERDWNGEEVVVVFQDTGARLWMNVGYFEIYGE